MNKSIVFGFITIVMSTGCASTMSLQSQIKEQDVRIDELQAELNKSKNSHMDQVEVVTSDTVHWVFEHAVLAWESETSVEIRNHIKEVALKSLGDMTDEMKARASKCFDDIVSSRDDKALSCFHEITHI